VCLNLPRSSVAKSFSDEHSELASAEGVASTLGIPSNVIERHLDEVLHRHVHTLSFLIASELFVSVIRSIFVHLLDNFSKNCAAGLKSERMPLVQIIGSFNKDFNQQFFDRLELPLPVKFCLSLAHSHRF
jgi:hypothetical protein